MTTALTANLEESDATGTETAVELGDFLTKTPVLVEVPVSIQLTIRQGNSAQFTLPRIELYCSSKSCGGIRYYDCQSEEAYLKDSQVGTLNDRIVYYRCRNCARSRKTFALRYWTEKVTTQAVLYFTKIGEDPKYGEPRPNIIRDVLEGDMEYFDSGYTAEMAGLGIGAFAYYRRFVESHKDRIIDEIKKVAISQGAPQEMLDTLDRALTMNSFEAAVKTVKDAIPDSLRYAGGHNPLTLLHNNISEHLHNHSDEKCLEIATDIRLLLTDLAERTSNALKRKDEVGAAVNRMLKRNTERAAATALKSSGSS